MATQSETDTTAAGSPPSVGWSGPPSRHAIRNDFRGLKPTLLAVFAVIAIAVVAVSVDLVVYSAADVAVSESDYRITMTTTLRPGHHTIALTNAGKIGHELILFRTDLPASALPVDAEGNVNEESPLLTNVLDSGDALEPGRSQSLTVTLDPGHYVAVCNLPAHYGRGMHLDVTVTG